MKDRFTYQVEALDGILSDMLKSGVEEAWTSERFEDGATEWQWDTAYNGASYVINGPYIGGWELVRLIGDETGGIADDTKVGAYASLVAAQMAAIQDCARELGEALYWEDKTLAQMAAEEPNREDLPYETPEGWEA